MKSTSLTYALLPGLCVCRGYGDDFPGYNFDGTYYRNTYSKNGLTLTSNNFGTHNVNAFATWMRNTRCTINGVNLSGEACARPMVSLALKDAAKNVVTDTGNSANMISNNNQTMIKSYVQNDQGQGPSVSGPVNGNTPQSCTATIITDYNAGGNFYYPGNRGVKATCKNACSSTPMIEANLDSVIDQFFTGMRDDGSWMSQVLIWNPDSNRVRVRCRVTIPASASTADKCPDYVPSSGCAPGEDEK